MIFLILIFIFRFKGMCLLDPSQTPAEACKRLEELKGQGFVGVRLVHIYSWVPAGLLHPYYRRLGGRSLLPTPWHVIYTLAVLFLIL